MQRNVSFGGSRLVVLVIVLSAVATMFTPGAALAKPASELIVLPGAHSAEGIALGSGATFFAGDAFSGDIYTGISSEAPPRCSSTHPMAAKRSG